MQLKLLKEGPLSEDCPGYVPGLLRRFSAGDRGQFVVSTWRAKSRDPDDWGRIVWHCMVRWSDEADAEIRDPDNLGAELRLLERLVFQVFPAVVMKAQRVIFATDTQTWSQAYAEYPAGRIPGGMN
jgi:hypothetical protein